MKIHHEFYGLASGDECVSSREKLIIYKAQEIS